MEPACHCEKQQAFLSSTSPAIVGDVVVAGFTSGEVMALNALNGTVLWGDSLQKAGQLTPLSDLNAIVGRVVIDKKSGLCGKPWRQNGFGGFANRRGAFGQQILFRWKTPWVAGEFIYLITKDSQVICFDAQGGKGALGFPNCRVLKNQMNRQAL